MTNDLDHSARAGRRALARDRIRRITSGLEDEADALADGVLVPKHRRLAPAEHWQPQAEPAVPEAPAPGVPEPPEAPAGEAPNAPRRPVGADSAPAASPSPAKPSVIAAVRGRLQRLARSRAWTASWLDRLLIVIEVAAMLGLVAAALVSFGMVDRLQQDLARLASSPAPTTAATVSQPAPTPLSTMAETATPAPTMPAELPGGRGAPTPVATPSAQPPSLAKARIIIPAIRVDAPIVEGDDWDTLKNGVGHHIGSALPGEAGNLVLSAHNDVYGAIFKNLNDLREDDLVLIDTPATTYRYKVTATRIVTPKETSVMDPTDEPSLTLITCYPPLVDTHRIVVTASFVK